MSAISQLCAGPGIGVELAEGYYSRVVYCVYALSLRVVNGFLTVDCLLLEADTVLIGSSLTISQGLTRKLPVIPPLHYGHSEHAPPQQV